MMRRRRIRFIGFPTWCLHRCGDQVILEVAATYVAIFVKRYLFIHRGSKPLCKTTMNLPFYNHRIDNSTAVIHRHEAAYVDFTGSSINIYNTYVASKGICQIWRIVVVYGFEAWLQVWRTVCVS